MTLIDRSKQKHTETQRTFKIFSVDNKYVKDKDSPTYVTKLSLINVTSKAFIYLSTKYKKNKLTFCIKETTQGSLKKIYGPYLGEKTKPKKPLRKYKTKNSYIEFKYKYDIIIKLIKTKGGYFYKVYKNGKKKRISKNEYLELKNRLNCSKKTMSV